MVCNKCSALCESVRHVMTCHQMSSCKFEYFWWSLVGCRLSKLWHFTACHEMAITESERLDINKMRQNYSPEFFLLFSYFQRRKNITALYISLPQCSTFSGCNLFFVGCNIITIWNCQCWNWSWNRHPCAATWLWNREVLQSGNNGKGTCIYLKHLHSSVILDYWWQLDGPNWTSIPLRWFLQSA